MNGGEYTAPAPLTSSCSVGKAAVLADPLARPLAAESDEKQ